MSHSLYYEGNWQQSKSKEVIPVFNPANGLEIGTIINATEDDMKQVIDSASEAFTKWSRETAYYRCNLLEKVYDIVIENKESLAKIMTEENGKPYSESLGEVVYAANYIKWYSEEGKRVYGDLIPASFDDKRIMVQKQAVGVVYGITPWNFPLAMITRKLAPALAAGCSFIIKPAEETPLTAVRFFELIHDVLPKGVLNMITGDPKRLTKVAMGDARVRKITFTGSTQVGKLLMSQASQTVKNISLELGGHAPLIVFEDACLNKAIDGTMASKFRNCGQVCIATNRVLVHESIKEEYLLKLKVKVEALKVGSGFEDHVKLGPIINKTGLEKIEAQIKDALAKGAVLITGGNRIEGEGLFFEPTILDGVTKEMDIFYEETFGPIIPIISFNDDEKAVEMANDTNYGLAAYYFTENLSKALVVSERLEYGIIGVNTGSPSSVQAPFGGFKESGLGREGGYFGIEEYLETKYVCIKI